MQPVSKLPRIAVLGAGHSGPVIARAAVEAGYDVSIAGSADPALISLIADVLAPGATPRSVEEAVADADIVVLAIPIHRFAAFDPQLVAGKIVVDVMNYWPPIDGFQPVFEAGGRRPHGSPAGRGARRSDRFRPCPAGEPRRGPHPRARRTRLRRRL
jgi:hypothetical protein